MSLPQEVIKRVINLRKMGYSIPEISLKCNLPKSTVLRRVGTVKILPKYHQRWLDRRNASKITSERNWEVANQKARQIVSFITEKELALIGAALYWAEGSKRDFGLSNTDPDMIRIFLFILRNVFKVKDEDIKISLRIYEDLDKNACLKYWSNITEISLGDGTSINVLSGLKKGKLKYGMCRVRIRKGGLLLKEFFSIIRQIFFLTTPPS